MVYLQKKSCLKNSKNEGVIYFSKQIKDKAEVKSALYEHIISFPVADEKILNGLNEKLERERKSIIMTVSTVKILVEQFLTISKN